MSEALSQKIEHDVRHLIGDLHMQVIVLRAALDMTQPQEQPKEQPKPQPNPARPENPEPGHPGPSPDIPPPNPNRSPVPDPSRGQAAGNGHYQERIAK